MNTHEFNNILEARLEKIRSVMGQKAEEYSTDLDKLHNFKCAARINGTHPVREAHGFLTKHLVSYMDMIKKVEQGVIIPQSTIEEKFTDILNYFILQEAIITENNFNLVNKDK
jgi:hypothetical protein